MRKEPGRRGRFELQLRLVLVLLVLFLAALDLMNVVLLARARDEVERAESERAKTRGREAALNLGPDALASHEMMETLSVTSTAELVRYALDRRLNSD